MPNRIPYTDLAAAKEAAARTDRIFFDHVNCELSCGGYIEAFPLSVRDNIREHVRQAVTPLMHRNAGPQCVAEAQDRVLAAIHKVYPEVA